MPLLTRARYPNIYLTIHIRPGSFPPRYHWGIFIPHPPISFTSTSTSTNLDGAGHYSYHHHGTPGTSGTSGMSGTSGPSGTSGMSGTSGTSSIVERGVNFHVVEHPRDPFWRFEAEFNYNLNASAYVAAAIIIGQLDPNYNNHNHNNNNNNNNRNHNHHNSNNTTTNNQEIIEDIYENLYRIPIGIIPDEDVGIEENFTCRVWIREAIRVLHRMNIIECDSVYELEYELRGYGERARYFVDRGFFHGAYVEPSRFSR